MSNVASAAAGGLEATRAEVEEFLYEETALLDQWRLDDWYALFLPEAVYEVPNLGDASDKSSATTLFLIADDYDRLRHRIERLNSDSAYSERPRSTCARIVSNVRLAGEEDGVLTVYSVCVTYRSKSDQTLIFVAHQTHKLRRVDGKLRIAAKRCELAMNSLRPQGRVSILL